MTKDKLRKEYKRRRINLRLEEKIILNAQIFENLRTIDMSTFSYVHIYLTLEKFNEPDTSRFIKWISDHYPNIKLVISKSDFSTGEMIHYLLDKDTLLVKNNWGILEPEEGVKVDEKLIDLVLVPLLVVDNVGNRVGYGMGFYDRFLKKCRDDVKAYGISFFEPTDTITDVDEWDVKLSACMTPKEVIFF